jgi:RNA-binding protein 5/10
MFYESRSNFFYDPKSKLYYGNKKMAYFRYDKEEDPPFVQVYQMTAETADGTPPEVIGANSIQSNPDAPLKPIISIKLKTKKIKTKAAPSISKAQKEQAAIIEKWSGKRSEAKTDHVEAVQDSSDRVVKTAVGEPVCTICKRKFASIAKLELHKAASELHKKNVAKLAAVAEKRKEPPSMDYQDRAKKRREMHGYHLMDSAPVRPRDAPSPSTMSTDASVAVSAPADNLGSSNIGNQMLQKLGWKEGASLGRKGFEEENLDDKTHCVSAQGSHHDALRKDWDRIETLAGNAAIHLNRRT